MADTPNNPPNPSMDDMHWGIAYLREDIQDLRQEIRGTNGRIDAVNESLGGRIDAVNESLLRRIDAKFAQLLAAMVGMTGIIIGAVFAIVQLHTH